MYITMTLRRRKKQFPDINIHQVKQLCLNATLALSIAICAMDENSLKMAKEKNGLFVKLVKRENQNLRSLRHFP